MAVKFACAQWPWGVESKEDFIRSCKDMSEAGFRYFESVSAFIDTFSSNLDAFRRLAEEYDMHPVSFYFHLSGDHAADIKKLKDKIAFVAANDIPTICVQAAGSTEPSTEAQLRDQLKTISDYGRISREYGIKACLHPHFNTMVMRENEIDFIMQNADPELVAFGPDTAHLSAGGCDSAVIFDRYKDRIRFVHLKDLKGALSGSGTRYGVEVYDNFRELGEGDINFTSIFRTLKSVNFDGSLCCELDKTRFTNKESARMNMAYLKKNW